MRRAWRWYLAAGAFGGIAYYFLPPVAKSGPFFNVLGASSVAAILIGVAVHRPARRGPWYLFAVGQALFILGDVITYNYERFFHHEIPFPSIGDVFYLGVYPCLIAGILLLVKQRSPGRDRAGLIDSLIITIGVGLLSWEYLMAPYARDFSLSVPVKLTSIAYPLMDVLLLAVVVRLAVAGGRKGASFSLLVAGSVALLATDAAYGMVQLSGVIYQNGGPLEAGWLSFYLLWGAAALHPAMRHFGDPVTEERQGFPRIRLALLTGASLMAPLVLAIQRVRQESLDLPVILTASVALFLLAMARMGGLVRSHEVAEGRERALRRAGASLVAATGRDDLYRAAIEATCELVPSGSEVRMVLADDSGPFCLVASSRDGPAHEAEAAIPREAVRTVGAEAFEDGRWVQLRAATPFPRSAIGIDAGTALALAPLRVNGEVLGMLVVSGREELPATAIRAVGALASQVALALESEILTEDQIGRAHV